MDEPTLVSGLEPASDLRDKIGDAPRIEGPVRIHQRAEIWTIHDPH
jgi:hypothetical protein